MKVYNFMSMTCSYNSDKTEKILTLIAATVWFPLSTTLMIYSALLTAGTVALVLALWGKMHQKG